MKIRLNGLEDAEKQMERIERAAKNMANYRAIVRSYLPYAWGQEFGTHRVSGRRARRDGGTHYLTGAVNTVLSDADRDISEGLDKVTAPGIWVLRRLGLWARRLARLNAPRKKRGTKKSHNYRLYRSINYEVRKR